MKYVKVNKWIVAIFLGIGAILYINSNLQKNDTETTFNKTNNKVHTLYSTSPDYVMNEVDAQTEIDNIKTIQKEGWKLLSQNGQFVSFNGNVTGRNEIIEKSASNLMQGCNEITIDADGNVVEIKPSYTAKRILEEQQQIQQEKEYLSDHDIQFNIIQNNIADINEFTKNGYRFKISDDGKGTITTWNIKNKDDTSPNLEYSINKLMSYGISIKTDEDGKVIGFDFAQTDFINDTFDLYGMTE